jgi:hypothetical protein
VVRIHLGEPNFNITPRAWVLFVFSITFAVRTAQYFERFEQAHPQFSLLPGSLFEDHAEEPTLLRDTVKKFTKKGVTVIGVSPDTTNAQSKFKEKFDLNFTLLADAEKEIANKYGVMKEKNMYGKKVMGVARTTFVIENGKIAKIFNKEKPEGHAAEVLASL